MLAKPSLKTFSTAIALFAVSAAFVACGQSQPAIERSSDSAALREMTKDERQTDFAALVSYFKELYGPLKYKERRLGFKFADVVAEFQPKVDAAASEAEYFGLLKQFTVRFKDRHGSLSEAVGGMDGGYNLGFMVSN